MRKWLIICLIALLLVSPVAAETVTMQVDSKRIEGIGTGICPMGSDDFSNPMYIISSRNKGSHEPYILQEYPISFQDYVKIQIGQTVTLEMPNLRTDSFKVIKVE